MQNSDEVLNWKERVPSTPMTEIGKGIRTRMRSSNRVSSSCVQKKSYGFTHYRSIALGLENVIWVTKSRPHQSSARLISSKAGTVSLASVGEAGPPRHGIEDEPIGWHCDFLVVSKYFLEPVGMTIDWGSDHGSWEWLLIIQNPSGGPRYKSVPRHCL